MKSVIHAIALVALLAAIPLAAGCNREPDVREQVSRSLEQANLDKVKVDWDRDAKVVHLTGTVDSQADRQRAEQVATSAVGTSGTVLNELTVEGVDENTADNLDGEIRDRLSELVDRDQALRDRNIDFDVNNGVVTITGEVRSAAEKTRVEELVKSAPGVKDLANSLEVRPANQ